MPDDDLCRRAVAGDPAAWRTLTERFGATVRNVVRRRGNGEQHLAEDIEQDVWVAIHKRIGTFREGGCLKAWIVRVTECVIMDGWKRRTRLHEHDEEWIERPIGHTKGKAKAHPGGSGEGDDRPATRLSSLASDTEPPDEAAARHERVGQARAILRGAMTGMTPRQRVAISLSLIYGLRDHEVAERLSISRERVRQLLTAGKRIVGEYKVRENVT